MDPPQWGPTRPVEVKRTMSKQPSLKDMLEAGVHFGHQTSRWHPKMAPHIFGSRSGVHIIDLEKTQAQLQNALTYVKDVASRGGKILFVGTKRQARDIVKKYAEACGMPYVTERWLGGTLTNFAQIKRSIKELRTLKEQRDKGELRKYTKKEQLLISRKIEEMEKKIGGIQMIDKRPDVVFVVDVRNDKTAVREADVVGAKIVGLCDTNVNPKMIDYPIPANDDAVKSIELMTRLVSEAVAEGVTQAPKAAPAAKPAAKPTNTTKEAT